MSRFNISLDQTTAWIGAVFAVGAIAGGFYGIEKYVAKKYNEQERIEAEQKLAKFDREQKETQEKIKSRKIMSDLEQKEAAPKPAQISTAGSWGYSGSLGPTYWSQLSPTFKTCDAKKGQSPIDLFGSRLDAKLKPIKFFYSREMTTIALFNQTVRMKLNPGSYIEVDGDPYDLKEIIFRTPSEHHLQGLPYEMEAQLIHRNPREQVVIVSVLIKIGKKNAFEIFDMPEFEGDQRYSQGWNPDSLLPKARRYIKYSGSLTEPPCSKDVTWLVFVEPIQMTTKTIDRFVKLQRHNARALQPVSGRAISRSNR